MTGITLTARDISSIASAGVAGLAVLLLLVLFAKSKPPPPRVLWTSLTVIGLAALVQVATIYINTVMKARVTVTLSPTVSGIASFLPSTAGAPLLSPPRLWVSTGDPKCDRAGQAYDPHATGCLAFAQSFALDSVQEQIFVSVDDVVEELRDRIQLLTSVNTAIGAGGTANSPGQQPIGENGPAK